jgi:hypothetical protein
MKYKKKGKEQINNNNRSIEGDVFAYSHDVGTRYGRHEGRQHAELPGRLDCCLLRLLVSTSPARWLLSREHVRAPQEPAYSSDSLTENRQFLSLLRLSVCKGVIANSLWRNMSAATLCTSFSRCSFIIEESLLLRGLLHDRYHTAQAEIIFPCALWNICHIEQWFSTFVRPRPGKFLFYKTRARYPAVEKHWYRQ